MEPQGKRALQKCSEEEAAHKTGGRRGSSEKQVMVDNTKCHREAQYRASQKFPVDSKDLATGGHSCSNSVCPLRVNPSFLCKGDNPTQFTELLQEFN